MSPDGAPSPPLPRRSLAPSARPAPRPAARPSPGGNKRRAEPHPLAGGGAHVRRALRVDLDPGELLDDERAVLATVPGGAAGAFGRLLLWRRSMLYLGLFVFLPSLLVDTVATIVDLAADNGFGGLPVDRDSVGVLGGLRFLVLCVNVALAFGVYAAYRRWTDWYRSRRVLLTLWALAFLAPFAVALFPLRSVAGGNAQIAMLFGLLGALEHVLGLAPKVLALIPGVLRAAVNAKLLFPRATAPGWLISLVSPFYLLLLFVIMMLPYQLSGSPLIVLAILAFLLAPVWLWRSGALLARPTDFDTALALVRRTRGVSMMLNGAGALFLVLGVVTSDMSVNALDVLKLLLGVAANVFILSVVAMDLLCGAMIRAEQLGRALAPLEADEPDPLAEFIAASDAVGGAPTPSDPEPR